MPIHPDVAARFHYLDGLPSLREAYGDPVLIQQIRQFETWDSTAGPPAVHTRSASAPGPHGPVPVRIYTPAAGVPAGVPGLVWLHGGGFIGGDLDMPEGDWTAREVCAGAGAVVVSVDYRLAVGGACYPVPHDDTVAAVAWVRDQAGELGVDPARITIGGASAGGNLTAGAALKLRDRDGWVPAALALVYPALHARIPSPSPSLAAVLAELPPLFRVPEGESNPLSENYLGGPLSSADGYAFAAGAILDGLCPTLVLNAEYDHLRPSGEAFAAAAALAGVDWEAPAGWGTGCGSSSRTRPTGSVSAASGPSATARPSWSPPCRRNRVLRRSCRPNPAPVRHGGSTQMRTFASSSPTCSRGSGCTNGSDDLKR